MSDWSSDVCSSDLGDGLRDAELEQQVAAGWRDIYLGSREDVVAHANGRIAFAYGAAEGRYQLTLPQHQVDLLDSDTTVEQIAAHLAQRLASHRSGATLCVRAYEGVMKGAIAARSEEHTSELQSLMRISYAVFCLKK